MPKKTCAASIRTDVLMTTLTKMGATFATKDVSQHPDMLRTHPEVTQHTHYHAFVGQRLGQVRDTAGPPILVELKKGTRRGSIWRIDTAAKSPPVAAPSSNIGPQYPKDPPFRARMRLQQSQYRVQVLKVPCGTGPHSGSTARYGNMLREEDGRRGLNFLTDGIFQVVQARLAQRTGTVDAFRLLNNLLSSQPMCFNLFGPLVTDTALATRLMKALFPGQVERVCEVRIEWAPEPPSTYLADRTAFDAFIDYVRPDGQRAFVGFETKLTEPFSQRHYDGPSYRRWMTAPGSPWRPDAHAAVDAVAHNQLWRDHLLAVALRDHPQTPYASGRLVLIRHPGDTDCAAVVASYTRLIQDQDDSFIDLRLDTLLQRWRTVATGAHSIWLDRFQHRYLDELSDRSRSPERVSAPKNSASAVRGGHLAALESIERQTAYRQTLDLYDEQLGTASVYLRPTDKMFTVLSLDHQRCASMIGVSDRGTGDENLRTLPPTRSHVRRACEGYARKRDSLRRRSGEEVYALKCIRHAMTHGLRLPRGHVYFVHQEWRFATADGGKKLDLLAVDLERCRLVVIELKSNRTKLHQPDRHGRDAQAQAEHYAALLYAGRATYYPFFERLARALAKVHSGPEAMQTLVLDPNAHPDALAWAP